MRGFRPAPIFDNQTARAIAYAQNALAFLFLDNRIKDHIQKVYLFGSAVRGTLGKDSDIDIFIGCAKGKDDLVERSAKAAFSLFYQSRDYEKWKRFSFTYPFSVHAGTVEEWQLKTSIAAEGIILYSSIAVTDNVRHEIMIIMMLPKDKKKYLRLIRQLYGRKEEGYKDTGMVQNASGKKISTNVIIIPKENKEEIFGFLDKEKTDYSFREIAVF